MSHNGETWESAKPVRGGKNRPQLATLASTEEEIDRIVELLTVKVEELYQANRDKVEKQGQWLMLRDKSNMIIRANNERTSEDTRDSMARSDHNDDGIPGKKLWLAFSYAEGYEKSLNTEIGALKAQLSALQSKAKGIREVTGLG